MTSDFTLVDGVVVPFEVYKQFIALHEAASDFIIHRFEDKSKKMDNLRAPVIALTSIKNKRRYSEGDSNDR